MTDDLSDLTKMKMLADAGFHYPEPWGKYEKCVDFIKDVSVQGCDIIPENCLACDALKLLREIGES